MKKLRKWWSNTGIDMTVTILTLLLILCSCLFGYILGSTDGYVEGYVSGTTGQYEQNPGHNFINNIVFNIKALKISATYYIQNMSKEQIYIQPHEITLQYAEGAPNVDEEVSKGLAYIPAHVIEQFNNDKWHVIIQSSIDTMEYKGTQFSAAGYTDFASKTICLESNAKILPDIITHEFGHYFDYINNRPSGSTKWRNLYKTEWKGLYVLTRSFHDVDTSTEYFAEIFGLYLRKPELLKELCPESYNAMDKLVHQYE